tara:strand:- start:1013 stop:2275 length:1263 start_codon:yes stop_codon:yes gene_type:complete
MSGKWPGGFITKDGPVPDGPLENGAASGVWTMDQVADYVKQGIWPTQGLSLGFTGERIFIPYYSGTYTSDHKIYNFNTNTIIDLGQQSSNYMASNGFVNVCEAQGGKIVALASANTTNASYKNMASVSSSNSVTYYRMDPQNFPSYGSSFGQVTYNPDANRWMTTTYPHYNVGSSNFYLTFTSSASYSSYSQGQPAFQTTAPLTRMLQRDALANPTFGDYMVNMGALWGTGQYVYIAKDQTPYNPPSFASTALGSSQSYPRVKGIAPVTKDVALVVTGGYGDYMYTPATGGTVVISDFFGDILAAAGAYPGTSCFTAISTNVVCCSSNSSAVVFKCDTSFNIDWAIDVQSAIGGSNQSVQMVIGAGDNMYIWHRQTVSPYQHSMSKMTLDGSGGHTIVTKAMPGLTANKGMYGCNYQYFD